MNLQRKVNGGAIAGMVLLVLGTLLLLDNLNIIWFDLGDFIHDWWPAILILVGLNEILRINQTGGWFLIGLGTILLLKINHIIDGNLLFALVLILLGIGLIIRPRKYFCQPRPTFSQSDTDTIDLHAVFSDSSENITSGNFNGGNIQNIFGKIKVDCHTAKMRSNRCRLNIETVFGRTILIVPAGVRIEVSGSPVFGHIDNQTGTIPKDENSTILEIQAEVVFGNLEIRN